MLSPKPGCMQPQHFYSLTQLQQSVKSTSRSVGLFQVLDFSARLPGCRSQLRLKQIIRVEKANRRGLIIAVFLGWLPSHPASPFKYDNNSISMTLFTKDNAEISRLVAISGPEGCYPCFPRLPPQRLPQLLAVGSPHSYI